MIPLSAPSLMVLVLFRASPEHPPAAAICEDIARVELSRQPREAAQEVCVSPGLMTGFLFDTPTDVELQDEVRFAKMIRGSGGVSFVPPKDMAPGERLRLTAYVGGDESQQSITFTLVAHPGHATRQVEVYRDQRPRESLLLELAQERAKNQQLREESQHLQAQLARSGGLRGLFLSGAWREKGIPAQYLKLGDVEQNSDDALSMTRVSTYRSEDSVGVLVWLVNSGAEPWSAEEASLVGPTGEKLEGVRIGQVEPIQPQQTRQVFIEADAARGTPLGDVTIRLWGADGRSISISKVTFP